MGKEKGSSREVLQSGSAVLDKKRKFWEKKSSKKCEGSCEGAGEKC